MRTKTSTLAFRFTLSSVILSTVTAGLIGFYLVRLSYTALREQAQQGQLALAKSLASHIDQSISQAYQAVEVLARHPDTAPMEPKTLKRELSLVTSSTELLDALIALDREGRVVARSGTALIPRNLPRRSAMASDLDRVAKLRGKVLAEVYRASDEEPGVLIRAPIRREGEFVGVLAGILYLPGHSIGNLDAGKIGVGGYAYLADEDGVALVHPQKSRVLQDLSDNPAVKDSMRNREGITLFTNTEGEEVLSAYARVDTAGWRVIVRRPAKELFSPAFRMLKIMSVLLAGALAAGAVAMAFLAGRLAKPLRDLARSVQTVEWGRKGAALKVKAGSPLEIHQLGDAINGLEERLDRKEEKRDAAHRRAIKAERRLAETERLAAVGQMSAGLAHELNNPLTVIQGAAQVLAKDAKMGQASWLGSIVRETRRCKRLVNDLLIMSRPAMIKPQRVSLRAICTEAWNQVLLSGWKQAVLDLPGRSDLWLMADPDRVKQVLVNLFTNAIQASKEKQKVQVRWTKEGKRVLLDIRDYGAGMAAEVCAKAFQPFFTTKKEGTGLGLSIASNLVRAHGGRLRIEPREAGTSLVSDWPLYRAPKFPKKG